MLDTTFAPSLSATFFASARDIEVNVPVKIIFFPEISESINSFSSMKISHWSNKFCTSSLFLLTPKYSLNDKTALGPSPSVFFREISISV